MRTAKPLTSETSKEIQETFLNVDLSLIKGVYYFDGWSDYEECGGILIFQGIDDSIQYVEYGHCVMCEDNINHFNFEEIAEEEMEFKIQEMEKVKEENS